MGERAMAAYKRDFHLSSIISRHESILRGMVEKRRQT
jgi:hypothetical protein